MDTDLLQQNRECGMPRDHADEIALSNARQRVEDPRAGEFGAKVQPGIDEEASGDDGPPTRSRKKPVLLGLALVVLLAASWFGYEYWTVGRYMISTDDAYVEADFAILSPKITAYVESVPAEANAHVKAGDPLVVFETGDYRNALEGAEADLAAQKASINSFDMQLRASDAAITQAKARLEAAKATAEQTAADLARYQRLVSEKVSTEQQLESVRAAEASARAAVTEAEAGVATAEANRDVVRAQKLQAEAVLPGLIANRDKAQRDLDATVLRAPTDGVIGNLSIAVGDFVTPGRRLLAVVPLSAVYIDANYKETQIAELVPGTAVTVEVDAFPDREMHARVSGISPASGGVFSLLPPENATGNFTKVVQRVPVRIEIPEDVRAEEWLRPGLSVVVTADTRTTPNRTE
jgi:membrane fusion protein, multidrug efflux system